MSMRSALPFLLAAVLGMSAALLVACGSSASDRKKLIPTGSADRLKSALSDVRSAVDSGNCSSAEQAIVRARGVLVNLPSAVDDRLVARLRQGIDDLEKIAPDECRKNQTTSTETTTGTTTPETTSTPTTATTDTTTTPTTSTSTTTTTTTPTTTGTTTTAPPATTTTAPADPSGGTTTP
jgi:cell division septation protein DedD